MPLGNLPAARLAVSYLIHDPPSLLPHSTIPTLLSLPLPLGPSLPTKPIIRALVVDKDNTFCPPKSTALHPSYIDKLQRIRASPEFAHSDHAVLIVSNTAGSTSDPAHEAEAVLLEKETGIPVLRQHPERRKPRCGADVLAHFARHGVTTNPAEIAVVGDRLATDILLAREMGSWSVWVRDGWRNPETPGRDFREWIARIESRFERVMRGGLERRAPLPLAKGVVGEKA
jgi:phosphatidylglycerophosphatase GEP4